MDFLSIISAALAIQRERANKASDRKIEAYRLVSEVAVDAAQAGNMIAMAMPGIMLRLQALYPDQPELHASCSNTLTTMLEQSRQLYHMAENYKPTIENGSSWADWEPVLRKLHEWKSTASMLRPHTAAIIKRYEDLLTATEQTYAPPPVQPTLAKGDRGWDAPSL
ncbi:hypothetical protein [Agrobacterium tumefaciens]|uniref:hypothetical protein n=1 Tax=Agrobacterium tumefaciens TaxID=358 RepID=UPI001573182D|nr:hypothetical protein [Agrobacterium tumefaciens]NTD89530.1 hypothetical protein [Agrobacterium tumefaciens]NTD93847.1 hypothetical protein [Agrobacterium tumefaciens]NTE03955.1 hypothetical protein [Agrobacterium tumefaciens]NTE12525.1 hypothetical protein [Agrobacterium tumefaciens]NTE24651.1 hypothetical protein [Agrobacterium tumefaciens]